MAPTRSTRRGTAASRRGTAPVSAPATENATASGTASGSGSAPAPTDTVSRAEFTTMMQAIQTTIAQLRAAQEQQGTPRDKISEGPKPDKYEGGSKGAYNHYIREMEKRFANEGVTTDGDKIRSAVTFLKGRPDDVWYAYVKHHANPASITWEEFKQKILTELGDLENLRQSIEDEYFDAVQGPKESVLDFSARLDKLTEELGETVPDLQRMKKLRHGFKYSIKNSIMRQLHQATTHAELLAQAQRMEDIDNAKIRARRAYASDVPQQNRNNSAGHRGRGGFRGRGGRGRDREGSNENSDSNSEDENENAKPENSNGHRLSKKEHQRRKENNLCFGCGKPEHKISECPDGMEENEL